jgi:hypothetical protein
MKIRMLVAGTLAIAGMLALPATAMAGEVKGPSTFPVVGQNENDTGALFHANSYCAASGLNDMDGTEGQTTKRTQTPADASPGAPGGACRGGSNPERGVEE